MNLRVQKIQALLVCLAFYASLTFAGSGHRLCVSDDGQIKVETMCLPCCGDDHEHPGFGTSGDSHGEHDDCGNRSHFELKVPQWSKRYQADISSQLTRSNIAPAIDAALQPVSNGDGRSEIADYCMAFSQSPPSASICTTVLLC